MGCTAHTEPAGWLGRETLVYRYLRYRTLIATDATRCVPRARSGSVGNARITRVARVPVSDQARARACLLSVHEDPGDLAGPPRG
ncbi:hypothetical protein FAGKG844_310030 [Frankia sp. AgKG'84/4]